MLSLITEENHASTRNLRVKFASFFYKKKMKKSFVNIHKCTWTITKTPNKINFTLNFKNIGQLLGRKLLNFSEKSHISYLHLFLWLEHSPGQEHACSSLKSVIPRCSHVKPPLEGSEHVLVRVCVPSVSSSLQGLQTSDHAPHS